MDSAARRRSVLTGVPLAGRRLTAAHSPRFIGITHTLFSLSPVFVLDLLAHISELMLAHFQDADKTVYPVIRPRTSTEAV